MGAQSKNSRGISFLSCSKLNNIQLNMTDEKSIRSGQVYWQQLKGNNPRNKLQINFDKGSNQFIVHKIISMLRDSHLIRIILETRKQVYRKLKHCLSYSLLANDLQITEHLSQQHFPEKIEIKHIYFQGISLRELIQRNNSAYVDNITHIPFLLIQLLNRFPSIHQESLAILTFRNILISFNVRQLDLNLFSLVGIDILTNRREIESHQIRETLAFFPSDHFSRSRVYVSMRRALAVLLLGLVLGKQVDLHPKAQFGTEFTSRQAVVELIEQNKHKCQIILRSQQVKKQLKIIEKSYQIKLEKFLQKMLVEEVDMSWGEVVTLIFGPQRADYQITLGKANISHQISLDQYILKVASSKFRSLPLGEQLKHIKNRIVSIDSPSQELTKSDAEMLLIVEYNINFEMLVPHRGSLAALLYSLQDTHNSHFTLQVFNLRDRFFRQALQIAEPKYTKQSTPASYLLDENQEEFNLRQGSTEVIGERDFDVRKNSNGMTAESDNSNNSKGQNVKKTSQIYEPQSNLLMVQKMSCEFQPRNDIFTCYPSSPKAELRQENISYLSCEIWKETYIHKFKPTADRERVGTIVNDRLRALRDYSSIMTAEGDDS